MKLKFESQPIAARFIDPSGRVVKKIIEIRTHPITGRTSRIAFSRIDEKEKGTEKLPPPPPDAEDIAECPFCLPQVKFNIQRFYRSLHRNGYNLGLLAVESPNSCLELRVVIIVRSNYAPWVRSDFTGYEVMLGDMATFVAPEKTALWARSFFR